ncbi:MAG: hypothetical protein F4X98_15860 [Gammaproteobacteria bacterium]|nr:hypothetical protein [Gammaproteobacteria bacterium]
MLGIHTPRPTAAHRIALLVAVSVSAMASTAAEDCAEWDSNGYFRTASVEDVAECVRAGTDLAARGALGRTPLHVAAMHNDSPFVITALVAAGAEVGMRDERDHTPLHSAAMASASAEVVAALLRAGADPDSGSVPATMDDFVPPVGVSSFGTFGFELWGTPWYFERIEALREDPTEAQAPLPNQEALLANALVDGENPKIFSLLVELAAQSSSWIPSRAVAWSSASHEEQANNDIGAMSELLNFLKERDKRGLKPLHVAARFNRSPAVVQALAEGGADVDAMTVHDFNALHVAACFSDSAAVIAALAAVGVDANGRDMHDATPLHAIASAGESGEVVKALLKAGADINARDNRGRTPLHRALARYLPSSEVVVALIAGGADMDALDSRGRRPEDSGSW